MKKGKSFGHLLAGLQKVILRVFTALMSTCTSGSCVTGTMKVLREHYERLGTASLDDQFDESWKEHIEQSMVKCLVHRRIRFWIEKLVMKSVLKA